MAARRSKIPLVALALVVVGSLVLVMRQGAIPIVTRMLPALDLAVPDAWLIDWRLAALRGNESLCRQVLKPPHITASHIPDRPLKDGCGWQTAVRVSAAGGATFHVDAVSCEVAAAVALWVEHEVQPRARHIFNASLTGLRHFGSYSCRNIVGSKFWKNVRSEHATANAIDIAGFTLSNGRHISVLRDWSGKGPESRFLHEVHASACRYFRVALGPEFNAAHRDHFHFDRGFLSRCR